MGQMKLNGGRMVIRALAKRLTGLIAVLSLLLCSAALAQETDSKPGALIDAAARQRVGEQVAKAFVQVEITAQYHNGQAPNHEQAGAFRTASVPTAGVTPRPAQNWEQLIDEERPSVQGGFLLGPTRVYTFDPLLHPRFIKSIRVRFGGQVVDAKPSSYPIEQGGMFLELAAPLLGTEAIKFDSTLAGPYLAAGYDEAGRLLEVGSMSRDVTISADGKRFVSTDVESLFVNASGVAVGLAGTSRLAVDDSWKSDPASWLALTTEQMTAKFAAIEKAAAGSLLRVTLALRSPPSKGDAQPRGYGGERDESDSATEWNGTGLLVDDGTVVVLAKFKPKVTARLERVRVFDSAGKEHAAKFASTLKDWGGFTAKLDAPISGAVRIAKDPIKSFRDRLLVRAEVAVRGEARSVHVWQQRIFGFIIGRRGEFFPELPTTDQLYRGVRQTSPLSFVFGLDGSLIALPVQHREKITSERGESAPLMVPAAMLMEELSRGVAAFDVENRPLAEEEENRLAWLGVELQGLDPELARANNVSEQTEDGTTGAIVTFVYENSPAATAELKSGDILLRIHVEGQPKPLEIAGDFDSARNMQNFWQYLDQIPPEYFDRIPTPWPASETTLIRSLTDLGFGTAFSVEIFRDGKVSSVDLKVAQSPPHYEAAKRFTSDDLGITVRNITYEVRRYFRLKPGDPGVIVSKVEKGGKAAISGVKPYEIVTSINDQPITSVADAEKGLKAGGEMRIGIKRMTQGRIVKVKAGVAGDVKNVPKGDEDAPASAGEPGPAEKK